MTSYSSIDWSQILTNISDNAHEAIVCQDFVQPLLKALGFAPQEWFPEFPTGRGADRVDYAARKTVAGDIFKNTKTNPYILIEAKGRKTVAGAKINLAEGTPDSNKAKEQIKKYLLSPNCKTAQWGIITNATHIQLFRRHGKVVIPATSNYLIKKDNINEIFSKIKNLIDNPPKALSICIYNDKGGVGKTTTTANLATILACKYEKTTGWKKAKKVLIIDFDPQQGDLTASLGKQEGKVKLSDCLVNSHLDIRDTIQSFNLKLKNQNQTLHIFDFIPCDSQLENYMNFNHQSKIQGGSARLRRLIEPLFQDYDYIIFDSPTNWTFFSQSCVYASDVVLIPTQHNDFFSLKNAKKVIQRYIPYIQEERQDGKPIALPIFFNRHKQTDASIQRTHYEIQTLLKLGKKGNKILLDPDLTPYFYPKATPGNLNTDIFDIPQYAIIAGAGFARIPAALTHKNAYEYYLALAKEYFLYD